MSVCLKLKISVTTEPIGLYYSGNIPTGPVMVLGFFLGVWNTPNHIIILMYVYLLRAVSLASRGSIIFEIASNLLRPYKKLHCTTRISSQRDLVLQTKMLTTLYNRILII